MRQMRHHLLTSSDVVKGNELGLSEGPFCRHLGKAKSECSYITRSMGSAKVLPKLEALRMAIWEVKAT